jgi:hypothetical protein
VNQVPIQDVIALAVPEEIDCHDAAVLEVLPTSLNRMARETVWGQYTDRAVKPTLRNFRADWLITDDQGRIEEFSPAHDCARCRAGNDKAWLFLPDRRALPRRPSRPSRQTRAQQLAGCRRDGGLLDGHVVDHERLGSHGRRRELSTLVRAAVLVPVERFAYGDVELTPHTGDRSPNLSAVLVGHKHCREGEERRRLGAVTAISCLVYEGADKTPGRGSSHAG